MITRNFVEVPQKKNSLKSLFSPDRSCASPATGTASQSAAQPARTDIIEDSNLCVSREKRATRQYSHILYNGKQIILVFFSIHAVFLLSFPSCPNQRYDYSFYSCVPELINQSH